MTDEPQIPRRLLVAVALVAAAMLGLELQLTRVFSVLFYYHFSFFSVSLVMSGLAFGGLLAARWDLGALPAAAFDERLARLAAAFAAGTLAAVWYLGTSRAVAPYWFPYAGEHYTPPTLSVVLPVAVVFLPGLTAAGAFLACAFARREAWVPRLYAADLLAAAAACLLAVPLMRVVQGPGGLMVPVALAAAAGLVMRPGRAARGVAAGALIVAAGVAGVTAWSGPGSAGLAASVRRAFVLERWNEHSRVVLSGGGTDLYAVIDKSAGTALVPPAARAPGAPPPRDPAWTEGVKHLAYRLGRPLERTAVIGVGGGRDVLAAVASGARHVDGYELNGLLLEVLRDVASRWNDLARWPEVTLVHDEARVAIARSGRRYDVIQASQIDTWAATASGGMVLAENGLYTVEGWRSLFGALGERGVLTMGRFYVPHEPAEAQRLVALAAQVLEDEGVGDPRQHVALLADRNPLPSATILVSRAPFTSDEVARLRAIAAAEDLAPLVLPDAAPLDPTMHALLDPTRRAATIAASRFDLSPPTDLRPYFFLFHRPGEIDLLGRGERGLYAEATTTAVRVLVLLAGLTAVFAVAVFALASWMLPAPDVAPRQRGVYRWSLVYFLGIGLGYVLVQLGLHQRLIVVLGHPTASLVVVLAAMLVGSGAGARASAALFAPARFTRAWLVILAALLASLAAFPAVPALEAVHTGGLRAATVALWVGAVGFVLGFGFPLGVRLIAPTGARAVQQGWAVNGAASIAGGGAAAILSVGLGSHAVLAAGAACYALVLVAGRRAQALAAVDPDLLPRAPVAP